MCFTDGLLEERDAAGEEQLIGRRLDRPHFCARTRAAGT
ncbi:hypothetical protein ABT270_12255 [Streptomyces sp900105245]|uniref:PPM-type phosphatase domain-containing protein n=1 Tax=Streptomyces sp. 900105245 TaxID=3154379 RepID=A0ABV1UAC5_9ACTN